MEGMCGSAAVTLSLLGGRNCRPPVTWMGGKVTYAEAVLACAGLAPGDGIAAVVLVDVGAWPAAWRSLSDPIRCRAVAAEIRSWTGTDREAWDAAKAAGPLDGEDAARWLWVQARNMLGKPNTGNAFAPDFSSNGKPVWNAISRPALAARIDALTGVPWPSDFRAITGDAAVVLPRLDLGAGDIVYLDPPYAKTTGYGKQDIGRDAVVALALHCAETGADVMVSEAEALPGLVASGWYSTEIAQGRLESARGRQGAMGIGTMACPRREFVTTSFLPRWQPASRNPLLAVAGLT